MVSYSLIYLARPEGTCTLPTAPNSWIWLIYERKLLHSPDGTQLVAGTVSSHDHGERRLAQRLPEMEVEYETLTSRQAQNLRSQCVRQAQAPLYGVEGSHKRAISVLLYTRSLTVRS